MSGGELFPSSGINILFSETAFFDLSESCTNIAVNACGYPPELLFWPGHEIGDMTGLVAVWAVR